MRSLQPLPPGYVRLDDTKTWQLEALPPDELARIVCAAIEERLDREAYDDMLAEEEVREKVISLLRRQKARARSRRRR